MDKSFKLNIKKSPVDHRDYVAETIYSADGEPPLTLDLRADLNQVRDQGAQGACAGEVAACMKEWQERQDVNFLDYMSPQFIYNSRENQGEEGMYSRDVMSILYKFGSVKETDYPYLTFTPITQELLDIAAHYKIQGYASVNTVDGLKRALYKNGPCYFAIPVYNYGMRLWKPRQGDSLIGGHAITAVGYNEQGFILRNSWGENWGDKGYTVFPYEDWGLQWEVWTTIDAESGDPFPPPSPDPTPDPKKKKPGKRKGWLKKFFEWLDKVFG